MSTTHAQLQRRAEALMNRTARVAATIVDAQGSANDFAAATIATLVRAECPTAAAIRLVESDEPGSALQVLPRHLLDHQGHPLAEPQVYDLDCHDSIIEAAIELSYSTVAQPHLVWSHDRHDGYSVIIDIDAAIAAVTVEDSLSVAVGRGQEVVDRYSAEHGDPNDELSTVKDLLTDLIHWADTRSIDIADLFEGATRMVGMEHDDWERHRDQ